MNSWGRLVRYGGGLLSHFPKGFVGSNPTPSVGIFKSFINIKIVNSIEETIDRLNTLQEKLKTMEKEYELKKMSMDKEYKEEINKIRLEIDKEIEQRKIEIDHKLDIKYNNIAQNTIMYYESINFKEIDPSQIADLMLSLFKRELDEIRKNI